MSAAAGKQIHITGIVQGVGFRPFVYGLAKRFQLTGWVRNTSAGVDIEVAGSPTQLAAFLQALQTETPPLARIDRLTHQDIAPPPFEQFEIVPSTAVAGAFIPISPDMCVCDDCLREMNDPADRRFGYPFINCTNCGPRFTIIQDIPYDRPQTTMSPFPLCPDCATEYHDPLDRRFHAQPVACPACGPHIWLEINEQETANKHPLTVSDKQSPTSNLQFPIPNLQSPTSNPQPPIPNLQSPISNPQSPIPITQALLAAGKIVAIKGLGGFHLACDGRNETAVAELRRRKLRRDKPFAVMMPDINTIKQYCYVNQAEEKLLLSRQRPLLILRRKPHTQLASQLAPGQNTLGVMLPYTPLHYLLFQQSPHQISAVLVMTSANLSEEPIAYTNPQARTHLAHIADAFLMHNRDIHMRCDDSVAQIGDWGLMIPAATSEIPYPKSPIQILRRARGYAPDAIQLHRSVPPLLATGAELKSTFCLTRDNYAFLSHHIGDLENYETLQSFTEAITHYERLFRITPQAIAYDLHPNYLATRYAQERAAQTNLPLIPIQHHHAHIAACLADNHHPGDRPVIGVSFDGTGYGDDGAIWGGEFLISDYKGYQRAVHLAYVPLPGGDKATREPWRMALAYLHQAGIDWADDLPPVHFGLALSDFGAGVTQTQNQKSEILKHQLEKGINAPPTSSMGRLFDAVAALIGVRQVVNYEAQAAIEMEMMVDGGETAVYPPSHIQASTITVAPLIHAIVTDLRNGVAPERIAARFHNSIAHMVVAVCQQLRQQTNLHEIALSGGVWQNNVLLNKTIPLLQKAGFTLYLHHQVPPNDGGLALGQAIIAAHHLR